MSNFEQRLRRLREISSEGYALQPDGTKDKGLYSYPVLLIEDALKKIIALEKKINTDENMPLPERRDNENNTLSEVKDVITELEILMISPLNDQSYKKLVAKKNDLEKLVTQKTSAIKGFQREIVKLLEDLQRLSKFEATLNVMVDKSWDQLETMQPDSAVPIMGVLRFSDEKSTDKAN